ncbi:AMP-binding protein [Clostridium sp. SM-530-WT-3G]|uniref:AMP-binding protein n=1 Tax=Clostridium sp. SM-530-WT-3G TaxID=2725303 RepID=UPI00145CFBEF|nr:AMP-binding protein [Clostridium sp. SM-530-WT-3G]NME82780.1 AMP-binding protein [Clostridium sp. SM-530-WT-3G]
MWKFDKYSDKVAAVDENGEKITYHELDKKGEIIKEHIRERALVFSLCTNTLGSLLGYTSFLNNNIVPLLLDAGIDRNLLKGLIENYKPDYLWIPLSAKDKFKEYTCILELFNYSLVKTKYNHEYKLHDNLALLLTTSGSTGSPKLVRQSYRNILANTESIVQYLEIDSFERPITTLPMNYTYGLSIINSHLYAGATILLTTKTILEKQFWKFFRNEEATSFGGVPYTYEILNKLKFFRMDLPSLKTITQAGGKLSLELHKKFAKYAQENNIKFVVMYGQTEATARMAYLPHYKSLEKYGSVGVAIPGGEFELIDINNNKIIYANVVGELKYKGDNVTLGYAECGSDLSKGDENRGVLVTGDMAKRDDDGYFYIVGRKKRFLKIFGNRINLDEAERLLKNKFQDIECACSGVDDKMYIFVTDISLSTHIKKFITETTGLNLSAFKIREVNEIPKNEAGKTLYAKLEEFYD